MKILLGLSLVLNLVLGWKLMQKEEPKVERLIIETHPKRESVSSEKPKSKAAPSPAIKEQPEPQIVEDEPEHDDIHPMYEDEFQVVLERMEQERTTFLTDELGLPQEVLLRYQQRRLEYDEQVASFWKGQKEPSFEDREKMLQLEKQYYQDLQAIFGPENWRRYEQYREEYNSQGMKRQVEENRPFLFMGP